MVEKVAHALWVHDVAKAGLKTMANRRTLKEFRAHSYEFRKEWLLMAEVALRVMESVEVDRLKGELSWIADTIDKHVTNNDVEGHRLILGEEIHTGPVVDWSHAVLMGLRDIARKALNT